MGQLNKLIHPQIKILLYLWVLNLPTLIESVNSWLHFQIKVGTKCDDFKCWHALSGSHHFLPYHNFNCFHSWCCPNQLNQYKQFNFRYCVICFQNFFKKILSNLFISNSLDAAKFVHYNCNFNVTCIDFSNLYSN